MGDTVSAKNRQKLFKIQHINHSRYDSTAFSRLNLENNIGEIIMDKINPLFTATATAIGGRNGHSEASDGSVNVALSVPKELGGPGKPGTTTPEHLFATGYAACFGGSLDFIAKQHKKDATKAKVRCAVSIGPREKGGFGIAVKMHIEDKNFTKAELTSMVQEAHEKICPYSHATRGNIDISFEVVGS